LAREPERKARRARPTLPTLEVDPDDEEALSRVVEGIAAFLLSGDARAPAAKRSSKRSKRKRSKPSKPSR
jgi:hypothetical protein